MESESFNNPFQGLHLADSVKKNITCEKHGIDFSDENIQKLFGHEAAEDETITNLKKYYFRTDIYEQVSANLKLRGCQLNNDAISFQLPLTWNLAKSAIVRSTISRVLDTTIDFLLKRANQCLCLPLFCSRYTVCDLL